MTTVAEAIRRADATGDAYLIRLCLRSGEDLRGAVLGASQSDLVADESVALDLWHLDRADPTGETRIVKIDDVAKLEVEW
ncbi:hypothetical protein [Burkholderia stabilis]|uniref:hypothetical protein n=1 Tax=Burkholderia stabilis TaxID=95485 RepID=UPI001F4A2C0D|nr:hypothetical protein [Burkholderia stabilis]